MIMLNRCVKEKRHDLIAATKIVAVYPPMHMLRCLAISFRNRFVNSLFPLFAQRLYFKIDRCLSVTQSDRRRSPTTRRPYRVLLFSSTNGALSPLSRTVLCVREFRDSCIQTCTRYNEHGDNTANNARSDRAKRLRATIVVGGRRRLTERIPHVQQLLHVAFVIERSIMTTGRD